MNLITIDLHTHLNEKNTIPSEYWKRVKLIGLNAVAITEHNYCNPRDAFEKLNKIKPEDVVLIPGIELDTDAGHALVYAKDESLYDEIELFETKVDIERVMEIIKEKNFFLSFSHPYGYENDSVCFLKGTAAAKKLIRKNQCGVEIYNGMISHLSNFLYDSQWIAKPINFFSFLEKNMVSKKIGLGKVGVKIKDSLDSKRQDILMRCIKSIELGKEAGFITAGSDAHSAERIGTGIMKIKFKKELTEENILESLKQKENIEWSGPLIVETRKGVYEKVDEPLKGKEIVQGVKYITTKAVKKGSQKIKTNKITNKITGIKDSGIEKIKEIKIKDKIKESQITKKIKNIKIQDEIKNRLKKE